MAVYDLLPAGDAYPVITLAVVLLLGSTSTRSKLGSEFMPARRGRPAVHADDRPEHQRDQEQGTAPTDRQGHRDVPGSAERPRKIGRAEGNTDPAPLSMIETVVPAPPGRVQVAQALR